MLRLTPQEQQAQGGTGGLDRTAGQNEMTANTLEAHFHFLPFRLRHSALSPIARWTMMYT